MNIRVLLFIYVLMLCIGCHQDPFHKYPDYIKQAIPYEEMIEQNHINFKNRIVSENFARITTNGIWRTSVGDDFAMVVTGQVFLNEDDFDDFNIDLILPPPDSEIYSFEEIERVNKTEKKYLFKWTPSANFLGDQLQRTINLGFQIQTFGDLNIQKAQSVPLFVYKVSANQVPEITSIVIPSSIRLGSSEKIKIYVKDESSSNNFPPSVEFNNTEDHTLMPFISFVGKEMIRDFYWEFTFDLEVDFFEGFIDPSIYLLDVTAVSAFNKPSSTKQFQVRIVDSDFAPRILGPTNITVYRGSRNYIPFKVFGYPFNRVLSARLLNLNELEGDIELIQEEAFGDLNVSLVWDLPLSQGLQSSEAANQLNVLVTSKREEGGQTITEDFQYNITVYSTNNDNR